MPLYNDQVGHNLEGSFCQSMELSAHSSYSKLLSIFDRGHVGLSFLKFSNFLLFGSATELFFFSKLTHSVLNGAGGETNCWAIVFRVNEPLSSGLTALEG